MLGDFKIVGITYMSLSLELVVHVNLSHGCGCSFYFSCMCDYHPYLDSPEVRM